MQVSVDNTAGASFDVKSLAEPGRNVFAGNICLTGVNAPCPALETFLTARPNPVPVTGAGALGMTTLSWSAPDAHTVEIHVGAPDGKLLTRMGNRGSIQTGAWVTDGTTFYLQDVTGDKALTAENTIASVTVRLERR